jgi:Cof subfamily protein (haloacid dehalogenase superfamily)
MIKLFAFDLDGTALDSTSTLREETIAAMKKLDENGIKFVFSTGRAAPSAHFLMSKTGIDNPIVANNGAIVYLNRENVLKSTKFDLEILRELQDYASENKLYYHFYDKDTFYSERLDLNRIDHLKLYNDYGMNYQVSLNYSDDPVKELLIKEGNPLKFQIFINPEKNEQTSDQVMEYLKNKYGSKLYITRSAKNIIEIMMADVSKWNGILEIADKLGIKEDEIAAIGDQDNDLPMIRGAKYGFAMGNSIKEVKDSADFVVGSNDDFGAVQAIEKVLEINRNV